MLLDDPVAVLHVIVGMVEEIEGLHLQFEFFALANGKSPSQAEIVPLRLAKMNAADPPSPPCPTGKDEEFVFETWPVGPGPPVGGIATVRRLGLTPVAPVTE